MIDNFTYPPAHKSDTRDNYHGTIVADDGRYLLLHVWQGTEVRNRVYYRPLAGDPTTGDFVRLLDEADARYEFAGSAADRFYFHIDLHVPRGRVIAINLERPARELLIHFQSFLYPPSVLRYDFDAAELQPLTVPPVDFNPAAFETRQVFYTSADGMRVPTLIVTADTDERVVPMHAKKLAATLQAAASRQPILLRVETKAGHGVGKPTSKAIEELADIFAFLHDQLRVAKGSAS